MRLAISFAVAVILAATGTGAEDAPKGLIGVQLKVTDGKIVVVMPLADGPADKAGIKTDDVVLRVNDFKVKEKAEQEDLQATIKEVGKYEPGEKIKLTIKRADKEMTIEITVGKRTS